MKRREDRIFLRHILDAIGKIEEYIKEQDEKNFLENTLVQDGVIRQLEIIGEAVKCISSQLRNKRTNIPWQDMAGMRDKLIHHYFGVDIEKVWFTVQHDLPFLKVEITGLYNDLT